MGMIQVRILGNDQFKFEKVYNGWAIIHHDYSFECVVFTFYQRDLYVANVITSFH